MPDETILILGGTSDARHLAARLAHRPAPRVVTSLAGRTADPLVPRGEVRVGGFGGVTGLVDYIAVENVSLVIDATHPFASGMTDNAVAACAACTVDYVRLDRPPWTPGPGDVWRDAATLDAAAMMIEPGARALVTVGRQELAPFTGRSDVRIVARMIERAGIELPESWTVLLARPPFSLEDERSVIADHGVTVLVTKNSGGAAISAKLTAAREADIPVIMISRPDQPDAPIVHSVDSAIRVVEEHFGAK